MIPMNSLENKRNLSWGLVLISFGIAAMMNSLFAASDWLSVAIIGLGGLLCLAVFFTNTEDWVLLIPAYVLLAAAGIASLALLDLADGDFFPSFVLFLVGLPFLLVFLRDRKQWWFLIPAYVLFVIALVILGEELGMLGGAWIGSLIVGSISIPFLIVFLINREFWWALIPFYVLFSIAAMIALIDTNLLQDAWIATYVLGSIGLPFLAVYLLNREHWWALIPTYVMFSIALMVGLIGANLLTDLVIPAYVMLSVALPFFVVYFINREQRWALIPGGITGVIGLGFLLSTDFFQFVFPAALILLGGWVLLRAVRS